MTNYCWSTNERRLQFAQRRGMTLVEVCVAVAISVFLLGIAITMLVRLQRWDTRFRDEAITTHQAGELAELIRKDVRSSTNVTLASPQVLRIDMQVEGQVRYELTPDGCLRIAEQPAGKVELRELFRVGPELIWNVEASQAGVRSNVVVTLERKSTEPTSGNRVLLLASGNRGADLPLGDSLSSEK